MSHPIPTSAEADTQTHTFQDSQPLENQVSAPNANGQESGTQAQTQAGQIENGRRTPMDMMSPGLGSPLVQEQAYFNARIQNQASTSSVPMPESARAPSQMSMLHQQAAVRASEKQAPRTHAQAQALPTTNGSGNESAGGGTSAGSERASSRQGSMGSRLGSMTRRFSQLTSGGKKNKSGKGTMIGTLSED